MKERRTTHTIKITWQEVAERDGIKCALCGREVNPSDIWYSETGRKCFGRTYPTVDHIIPLEKGGMHTLENVQLACKRCNSSKGSNETWVY